MRKSLFEKENSIRKNPVNFCQDFTFIVPIWLTSRLTSDTVAITVWLLFNGPTPFPTRNLKKKSCLTHGSIFRSTLTLLKSHFALVVRFLFDGDLLLHSLLLIPPSLTGVISTLAWTLLPSTVPEEHHIFMKNAVKWLTPTLQKLNLWIFYLFKPPLFTPNSKYTISNTKCPITETYEKNTCRELKVDDKRRKLPKHWAAVAEHHHQSPHRTPSHCTVTGWRYCNCNTIIGISSNGVIPVMVDWQVQ